MGLQLSQDAVVYIIVMLVVVLVGVGFILGTDIRSLLNFSRGEKFTNLDIGGDIDCEDGTYRATVNIIFDYEGPPKDIDFIPVLDIGNNPVWDNAKTIIHCVYDGNQHNCGQERTLTYVLAQANLKDGRYLGEYVNVDLIIFEDTESIRNYLKFRQPVYTSSNMVNYFTDYYKITKGVGLAPPGCLAYRQEPANCQGKSESECGTIKGCYFSSFSLECKACLTEGADTCESFGLLKDMCEHCYLSTSGKRCFWIEGSDETPGICQEVPA